MRARTHFATYPPPSPFPAYLRPPLPHHHHHHYQRRPRPGRPAEADPSPGSSRPASQVLPEGCGNAAVYDLAARRLVRDLPAA